MLKEVDIIAITDHNSTKQLRVLEELKDSYDFLLVPGVEVTVKENFDVLCYFRSFKEAINFNNFLEPNLNGDWGIFNESKQIITDIYDETYETYSKPLTSTNIPYSVLVNEVRKLKGAIVLAHIDRPSKSVLNVFSLNNTEFDAIEIQKHNKESFLKENPELNKYRILYNSDSHTLLTISEKDEYIDLKEKTIASFFDFLIGEKL